MAYSGPERRKYPRIEGRFIVSYRVLEEYDVVDVSQTKNLSLGGILLTTNRLFNTGINLAMQIRLPFVNLPIMAIGRVIESREIIHNVLYDTRIQFISVDQRHNHCLSKTVEFYLKSRKEK